MANPKKVEKLKRQFFDLQRKQAELMIELEDEIGDEAAPFIEQAMWNYSEMLTNPSKNPASIAFMVELVLREHRLGLTVDELVTEIMKLGYEPETDSPRDSVYQSLHSHPTIRVVGKRGRFNVYGLKN